MAKHNQTGVDGENVAVEYVRELGWSVVTRNFRRPYGEIDIVARETGGVLVFIEVKTVSYGTGYRGEENVHPGKLKRLSRTIQSYLLTKHEEGEWRFDVVVVELNPETRKAKIRHLEDIVIGA